MKWNPEKIAFAKVELWMVALIVFFMLAFALFFGWRAQYIVVNSEKGWKDEFILRVAQLPDMAAHIWKEGLSFDENGMLVERNQNIIDFDEYEGFQQLDPNFKDEGLVLMSVYDDKRHRPRIFLYDLKDQKILWEWEHDYHETVANSEPPEKHFRRPLLETYHTKFPMVLDGSVVFVRHPYLLEDGRILFTNGYGMLVMLDVDGKVLWTRNQRYHHSIERMANGNFVVPMIVDFDIGDYVEDGYEIITPEGEVVDSRSIIKILEDNGYGWLLYGVGIWEHDVTHLNDVEPILKTDAFVQEGDLAFSLRHLSTVFLYRPSENRIIWLKTGPWYNQHDVDYQGNGIFTIFDNNLIRKKNRNEEELISNIMEYNMATGEVTTPFQEAFEKNKLYTRSQGLHQMLDNGDAMVEIQNSGELYRLSPSDVRWRMVHNLTQPGTISLINWSRYYDRDDLDLSWMGQQPKETNAEDLLHAKP